MSRIRREYIDVPFGQMHIAVSGNIREGTLPVVMLHQTPRSWDEFAEVLQLLGDVRQAVAIDLPGMGASDPYPDGPSIENYAAGVLAALDERRIDSFDLVGHHTGGVVALELAATVLERVRCLILSSTPYVDAAARERRQQRSPIDSVQVTADGRHLTELWQRRKPFYPAGRVDILLRFVRDALKVADPEAGHRAVAAYRMEERVSKLQAKILLIGHDQDPHASPELERLAEALPAAETARIPGGMVPLELTATRFAALVAEFLDRHDVARLTKVPNR